MPAASSTSITPPASGFAFIVRSWWGRRELVWSLTKRDLLLRYRGSLLGLTWSIITPLVLLMVYAVVFGLIFRMKWPGAAEGDFTMLALMMFCGMVPYNFMSEALARSTQSIVSAPNYVKRVAFPVEILPLVMVCSAFIHAMIGCGVLALGVLLAHGSLPSTWLLLPVIWIPLVLTMAALALLLSGVGVFIRDTPHVVGIAMLIIMFVTPIFYPDTMVPPRLQFLMFVNPLANLVTNMRKVCVTGDPINWVSWLALMGAALLVFALSSHWFVRIRRRFADVL